VRKVIGVVLAFLLAITLLSACASSPSAPSPSPTPPGEDGNPPSYTGFIAPAVGQWVEYVISTNGGESRQKMEYIGQDTVDGKTCTGFEVTMTIPGQGETIIEMWTDAATQQLVRYVIKIGDQVMCMDVSQSPYEPPETETPGEYDPSLPNISYGTYTTPTGKTVNVAKFAVSGGESWVSSQVPFGMVKAIDASGKTTMSLYDFGTSGAHRDISKVEMENCMQMPG